MQKILLIIILCQIGACKNRPSATSQRADGFTLVLKTKEDTLYHEVMQDHDIAMAKIGRLRKYISMVQHELDSMGNISSGKANKAYAQTLLLLQKELQNADRSMFTWMEEFKIDSAKEDMKKRLAYLESEKLKIEITKDSILKSLQKADSLFQGQ